MSTPNQPVTFGRAYRLLMEGLHHLTNITQFLQHPPCNPDNEISNALRQMKEIMLSLETFSKDRLLPHMDTFRFGTGGSKADFGQNWEELQFLGSVWDFAPKAIKWRTDHEQLCKILRHLERARPRDFKHDYAWVNNVYNADKATEGDRKYFFE